jgi:putative ABC transport system permease protein
MNKRHIHQPPKIAEWILKKIHSDNGDYTHLGDFREVFDQLIRTRGSLSAWIWYLFQVFRSIPGFVKNKIYWGAAMLRNYMTISFRNIVRNKWFSVIKIAGLAIGMAAFLLILFYVQFELSFDRFHKKGDRIYLFSTRQPWLRTDVIEYTAGSPEPLAAALISDIPEVVNATRIMKPFADKPVLQFGNKKFFENGFYADHNFLNIFTFSLLKGDPKKALVDPSTIVISKDVAQKLFGNEDPMGRTIIYRERSSKYDLKVTGVAEPVPLNSQRRFDYLISVETLVQDKSKRWMIGAWNIGNFTTFVELAENAFVADVEKKILAHTAQRTGASPEELEGIEVALQPLKDIHLRSMIRGEESSRMEIRYVYLFMSIALVILLIACINYMNLTTARSATRAREIGIRKVVGANRKQLYKQFIGESCFITLISMGIAMLIIHVLLPWFRSLIGVDLPVNYLKNPSFLISIAALWLFISLIAGSYPAFVLSAIKPVQAFRDFVISGKKGSAFRNLLVVVQFTAAVVLIVGAIVIFGQMNHVKNRRLGYDREHVIVIATHEKETGRKAQAIKNELLQLPEVLGVTVSGALPLDVRSRFINQQFEGEDGQAVKMDICFDYIDYDFLDVFKIEMAQGRNFSKEYSEDKSAVLVNETAFKQLGWTDPIGKKLPGRDEYHVVGVVKDFYFASLHQKIEPMMFLLGEGARIAVRVRPGNVQKIIALLKSVFERNTQTQPFDFFFLDDRFNELYKKDQRTGEIFGYFSLLAIFIACLGLLGLASFTVERRTKEIGIRRVLGASAYRIVTLLGKEYIKLVVSANIIAWPVAYFAMNRWLQNFAYRINMGVWMFLLAGAAALLIAFISVGYQTLKAALANPADTLRYE